jgi:hypothetical protein
VPLPQLDLRGGGGGGRAHAVGESRARPSTLPMLAWLSTSVALICLLAPAWEKPAYFIEVAEVEATNSQDKFRSAFPLVGFFILPKPSAKQVQMQRPPPTVEPSGMSAHISSSQWPCRMGRSKRVWPCSRKPRTCRQVAEAYRAETADQGRNKWLAFKCTTHRSFAKGMRAISLLASRLFQHQHSIPTGRFTASQPEHEAATGAPGEGPCQR